LPVSTEVEFGGELSAQLATGDALYLGQAVINPDGSVTYTPNSVYLFPTGVQGVTVTAAGTGFTSIPSVSASAGSGATFQALLGVVSAAIKSGAVGTGYANSDTIKIVETGATYTVEVVLQVGTSSGGAISTLTVLTAGVYSALPTNSQTSVVQATTSGSGSGAEFTLTWGVVGVNVLTPGTGYTTSTAITISGGGGTSATATAVISSGYDIQVAVHNFLQSAGATVLTVNCVDNTGAAFAATATFSPPQYASNQTFNFGKGAAVDLIPAVSGKQLCGITSISVSGGQKGALFDFVNLPTITTFQTVGFSNDKAWTSPARRGKAIPDGMEANAQTKRGRAEVANLRISSFSSSPADGLMRWDGVRCTAMLSTKKDDQLPTTNIVFTRYLPTCERDAPAGDGEVTANSSGPFKDALYFVAN
jgi:hypothetical protein